MISIALLHDDLDARFFQPFPLLKPWQCPQASYTRLHKAVWLFPKTKEYCRSVERKFL